MSSILETLQQECADRVAAIPFFANVPILVEHLKDFQSEYARALGPVQVVGGRSGACVTILTPTADCNWPEIGGPFFDAVPIIALVQENRQVNEDPNTGTQKSALAICEALAAAWQQFNPLQANGPLIPLKPTIARGPDDDYVNYNVRFQCMAGITDTLPQAATPTASGSGSVTLACSTAGAAIFYTQNGSNPGPRNGTLYTAPFARTGTVKARAWLAGYLTSETLTA